MAAAIGIRFGAHATPGEQDDVGAEAISVQLGMASAPVTDDAKMTSTACPFLPRGTQGNGGYASVVGIQPGRRGTPAVPNATTAPKMTTVELAAAARHCFDRG
jgi:hypothetical protein